MKLRHALKAYHTLPDFPRADDLYFELCQIPKYLKGEAIAFTKAKTELTFKIDKKKWEDFTAELLAEGLLEKIDKTNFKLAKELNGYRDVLAIQD